MDTGLEERAFDTMTALDTEQGTLRYAFVVSHCEAWHKQANKMQLSKEGPLTSHFPLPLQGLSMPPAHSLHDGPYVLFGQQAEIKNI